MLDQAIALHERNLADREQILGASHHDTLASRNNLAGAYESAGRLDEAVPLAERVLADRERTLGTRHPSTLAARNNLAYPFSAGVRQQASANAAQAAGRGNGYRSSFFYQLVRSLGRFPGSAPATTRAFHVSGQMSTEEMIDRYGRPVRDRSLESLRRASVAQSRQSAR